MSIAKSTTSAKVPATQRRKSGAVMTIGTKGADDGGGSAATAKAARSAGAKQSKPGTGLAAGKGPSAFAQKKGSGGMKLMANRGTADSGASKLLDKATRMATRGKQIDSWARGGKKVPC